jgi:hypothetical protein
VWVSRFSIALLVATLAPGCGGYVGHAKHAYQDGRYLEAAEKLGQHEADINDLAPRKQADYGIYFGLSLMMLGDHAGAYKWLSFASLVEQQQPGTLTPEQRVDLDRGLWMLSRPRPPPPGFLPPPQQTLVAPPPPGSL